MAGAVRKSFLYSTRADDRQYLEPIEPCGLHSCPRSVSSPSKVGRLQSVYSLFWGQAWQGLDLLPNQVEYFREGLELWELVPVRQLVSGSGQASQQQQADDQGYQTYRQSPKAQPIARKDAFHFDGDRKSTRLNSSHSSVSRMPSSA